MCPDGLRKVRKSELRLVISIGWKRELLVIQGKSYILLSISDFHDLSGELLCFISKTR